MTDTSSSSGSSATRADNIHLEKSNLLILSPETWPDTPAKETLYRVAHRLISDLSSMGYTCHDLVHVRKELSGDPTRISQAFKFDYDFADPEVSHRHYEMTLDAAGEMETMTIINETNRWTCGAWVEERVGTDGTAARVVPGSGTVQCDSIHGVRYCGLPLRGMRK